jgi:L-alanine-DL-glutamate epimerase-like enolase superfamily enzyme
MAKGLQQRLPQHGHRGYHTRYGTEPVQNGHVILASNSTINGRITLSIDVTGGEQDCYLPTWQRMIDMRAVDIVQPDILYLGGIRRALRIVEMARKAALSVTPHCANWSMVTLFTMHLLRTIPNADKYLEFSIEG